MGYYYDQKNSIFIELNIFQVGSSLRAYHTERSIRKSKRIKISELKQKGLLKNCSRGIDFPSMFWSLFHCNFGNFLLWSLDLSILCAVFFPILSLSCQAQEERIARLVWVNIYLDLQPTQAHSVVFSWSQILECFTYWVFMSHKKYFSSFSVFLKILPFEPRIKSFLFYWKRWVLLLLLYDNWDFFNHDHIDHPSCM